MIAAWTEGLETLGLGALGPWGGLALLLLLLGGGLAVASWLLQAPSRRPAHLAAATVGVALLGPLGWALVAWIPYLGRVLAPALALFFAGSWVEEMLDTTLTRGTVALGVALLQVELLVLAWVALSFGPREGLARLAGVLAGVGA